MEQEVRIVFDLSVTVDAALSKEVIERLVMTGMNGVMSTFDQPEVNSLKSAEEAEIYHGEDIKWTTIIDETQES